MCKQTITATAETHQAEEGRENERERTVIHVTGDYDCELYSISI